MRRNFQALVFWGALLALGFPACAGRSAGHEDGGESHFLLRCSSSCAGSLDCISGVCTKPCVVGDEGACSGLASSAVCTTDSGEPGAVAICDVGCVSDGDCSALGDRHACDAGYCRSPASSGSGGDGTEPQVGGTGGSGTGGGGASGGKVARGGAGGTRAGTSGNGGTTEAGTGGNGGTTDAATGGTGGIGGVAAGTGGAGGVAAGNGGTGGSGMPVMCETAIVTTPEKNYEYASSLTMEVTKVKPSSELTFDWSGVTADLRGHPVTVDDIDMIEMSLWEMPLDQFEEALNADTLNNPIVITSIMPQDGMTSASVFEVQVPAGPLDQSTILNYLDPINYPPDDHLYVLFAANGLEYGQGTRMMAGFQLDPSSNNTLVNIDSNSTHLAYSVSLASRPATYVPAGTSAITIDWTKLRVTAEGGELIPSSITRFRIGAYDLPPTELEGENFLDLDEIAVEMYEAPVDVGTKISFSKAQTKDGKAFSGIDDTHTWLVALNCGACQNPAPWYMSVLKPCPAAP